MTDFYSFETNLRRLSCSKIKESKSGVSGIDTFGGTCCNNSFIRGTRLTGFPVPPPPTFPLLRFDEICRAPSVAFCELFEEPLVEDACEGGGRPDGVANGGAARISIC